MKNLALESTETARRNGFAQKHDARTIRLRRLMCAGFSATSANTSASSAVEKAAKYITAEYAEESTDAEARRESNLQYRIAASLEDFPGKTKRNGLRVSLGVIFLWFGALKFFPGMSPAQDLAIRTIDKLTFGALPAQLSIFILATWECLIGIGLLINRFMRATLFLLFLQMIGAGAPLLLFPGEAFKILPIAPTLEGQYILKNLVLVSAGVVIGATVGRQRIGGEA